MKLNSRRTALIGFSFLLICAFRQMDNAIIPLILRNAFTVGGTAAFITMPGVRHGDNRPGRAENSPDHSDIP